jgi:alpha-N-acetylglucosamine transferase
MTVYKCKETNDNQFKKKTENPKKYAYVILLFSIKQKAYLKDMQKYVCGALTLGHILKNKIKTKSDLVAIVTPDIQDDIRKELSKFYIIKEYPKIKIDNKKTIDIFKPTFAYVFTKLHAFKLIQYNKIVLLDIDITPIKHFDNLFTCKTSSGIIELKYGNDESKNKYNNIRNENSYLWMNKYCKCCKHGNKIPDKFTKNIRKTKYPGINAGILVVKPNIKLFNKLIKKTNQIQTIKKDMKYKYVFPEQQFLTEELSWYSLDPRFGSHNGFPSIKNIFGIHHVYKIKPWDIKQNDKNMYPADKLWWKNYKNFLKKYKIKNKILLNFGK